MPAGAFSSIDSVVGRVTRVDVFKGEVIVPGRLAPDGTGPGLQVKITPGKRAIAVRIDDVSGLNGLVQPNSRVDILVVTRDVEDGQGGRRSCSCRTCACCRSARSVRRASTTVRFPRRPPAIEVTPEEAEQLAIAQRDGTHSARRCAATAIRTRSDRRREDRRRPRAAPFGARGDREPGAELIGRRPGPVRRAGPGPASAGAAAGGSAAARLPAKSLRSRKLPTRNVVRSSRATSRSSASSSEADSTKSRSGKAAPAALI